MYVKLDVFRKLGDDCETGEETETDSGRSFRVVFRNRAVDVGVSSLLMALRAIGDDDPIVAECDFFIAMSCWPKFWMDGKFALH